MLKYALLSTGEFTYIEETAAPPYFCPDCLSLLGKKRGTERIWHFFHLEAKAASSCKRGEQHVCHTALEKALQAELEKAGVLHSEKEYPIQEAKRIADLALPEEKIAIEIQRSPLSFDHLLEREEAYQKAGWSVIWLLSLSLWQRDALPLKMQTYGYIPHYFFEEGKEPLALWDIMSTPHSSSLTRPLFEFRPQKIASPLDHTTVLLAKRRSWSIHLPGDFLDHPPEQKRERPTVQLSIRLRKTALFLKLLLFRLFFKDGA